MRMDTNPVVKPPCSTFTVQSRVPRFLAWRIRCRELLTPDCGVERIPRKIQPQSLHLENPSRRCPEAATHGNLCHPFRAFETQRMLAAIQLSKCG